MFSKVGIVARTDRKNAFDCAIELMKYLHSREIKVYLEPSLAQYSRRPDLAKDLKDMNVDLIITVGGDGTILKTCLQIPKPEPPILAINMGIRGFLTEVKPNEGLKALERCLKGDYQIEEITKIASYIGDERLPDALNDVYITSKIPAKLLFAEILKSDTKVGYCRADGFVVATKAGATGYSLSAGGPLLDPEVNAFILTPICPLTHFYPLIFPDSSEIKIRLLKTKEAVVVIDGDYIRDLSKEENVISLRSSEYKTRFVRFDMNFYNRVRRRLLISRGMKL